MHALQRLCGIHEKDLLEDMRYTMFRDEQADYLRDKKQVGDELIHARSNWAIS